MKKIKLLLGTFLCSLFCGIGLIHAASGPVYVYYQDETGASRKPTYTYTNKYMSSIGYSVEGRKNWDSSGLLYALDDAKIFVAHFHGSPGKQDTGYINGQSYGIAGRNADGTYYKNVNTMANNSASQLKMAIFYGCSTGDPNSTFGNLPYTIVNRGAQTAVAWTVTTYVPEVNEWNRLFFEKAKEDTIVESFRHADYWLRVNKGDTAGDRMQKNRNEAGNIYGYVY